MEKEEPWSFKSVWSPCSLDCCPRNGGDYSCWQCLPVLWTSFMASPVPPPELGRRCSLSQKTGPSLLVLMTPALSKQHISVGSGSSLCGVCITGFKPRVLKSFQLLLCVPATWGVASAFFGICYLGAPLFFVSICLENSHINFTLLKEQPTHSLF